MAASWGGALRRGVGVRSACLWAALAWAPTTTPAECWVRRGDCPACVRQLPRALNPMHPLPASCPVQGVRMWRMTAIVTVAQGGKACHYYPQPHPAHCKDVKAPPDGQDLTKPHFMGNFKLHKLVVRWRAAGKRQGWLCRAAQDSGVELVARMCMRAGECGRDGTRVGAAARRLLVQLLGAARGHVGGALEPCPNLKQAGTHLRGSAARSRRP